MFLFSIVGRINDLARNLYFSCLGDSGFQPIKSLPAILPALCGTSGILVMANNYDRPEFEKF